MRKSSKPRKRLTCETIALTIILALTIASWQPVQAQRSRRGTRTTKVSTTKEKTNKGNNYDETKAVSLIDNFVNSSKSDSPQPDITPIRNYYNGLNNAGKQQMLTHLTDKTTQLLEGNNKTDALAHTRLYSALAPSNDEKLPTMLFIQGTVYAENLDSIKLKETIRQMEMCPQSQQKTELLPKLKENLENVRNYEPLYTKLGGEWVADFTPWTEVAKEGDWTNTVVKRDRAYLVDAFIGINYDCYADALTSTIRKTSELAQEIADNQTQLFGIPKMKELNSCYMYPTASDSLYICWSSENLSKGSLGAATMLRSSITSVAAEIHGELAQRNKYSFGKAFLGDLATSFGEMALNSIVSGLTEPRKLMYLLEGYLKIENEYTITGDLTYYYWMLVADPKSCYYSQAHCKVTFARWQPESGIVFMGHNGGVFSTTGLQFHPALYVNKKAYQKDKTTRYAQWKSHGNSKNSNTGVESFNKDQFKWLMLYNDSVLASQGVHNRIIENIQPFIGIHVENMPEKVQKKQKLLPGEGVYVTDVEKYSAAYVAGIKKNDIILSVNEKGINSYEDFIFLIENSRPGDWFYCKVLRKNKQISIPIRVTWK